MQKQQSGFTLIELIAVLVILGILAATAVPKFVNLSEEAGVAAINNIAGSIESAAALNHAIDIAVEANLSSDDFVNINDCSLTQVNSLLLNELPSADYTVAYATGETATEIDDKASVKCNILGPTGKDHDFSLIGSCGFGGSAVAAGGACDTP